MSSFSDAFALVEIVKDSRYTASVDVCALTILLYDYLITFGEERELIWSMPFRSPAKPLFLVTRYLPFVDTAICMTNHFMQHLAAESCEISVRVMGWLIVTGLAFSEIILMLRTWAVWDRDRRIAIGLAIWFTIIVVPIFVIMGLFLDSLSFTNPQLPNCFPISDRPIDSVAWILLVIFETGILIPMIIKAIQKYKVQGRSSLYRTVYLDGSIYYLYIFVFSTLNIACILMFPEGTKRILSNLGRVIHSVLTGRILLSIRGLVNKRDSRIDPRGERPNPPHPHKDGIGTSDGSPLSRSDIRA